MSGQPRQRPPRGSGQRGMTLIEVAIAISILAVMGVLTYGGIVITIRSQERAEALQERYHTARVALERMRRELGMAFVSLHQADDKRTQTLFEGERDEIVFTTSAHVPIRKDAHESDQVEVEYRVDRVDGEYALVRRVKLHVDDRPGRGGVEEVVAFGVERLELEYFDKAREDWTDDWKVRIEDAEEKRIQLKTVREQQEAIKGQLSQAGGQNNAAGAVASALADPLVDNAAEEASNELLEGLFLPSRVKIRLRLSQPDEDRRDPLVLETQAELPMTDPLWY